MKEYKDDEMKTILFDLLKNEKVLEMKDYLQHGKVSTYEHCINVAKLSYNIDKYLSLNCDLNVLLVGAMLHDFFLYDWHKDDEGSHRLHGFTHANTACMNAKKYFNVDDRVGHVISCHMWPLNLRKLPMSKEAWIVCLADKWVSLHETLFKRKAKC